MFLTLMRVFFYYVFSHVAKDVTFYYFVFLK